MMLNSPQRKLDVNDKDLRGFSHQTLMNEIIRLRNCIRYHRDQKGDDRCWLDDVKLYQEALPEQNPADFTLPDKTTFINSCQRFWDCRQKHCNEQTSIDNLYIAGTEK